MEVSQDYRLTKSSIAANKKTSASVENLTAHVVRQMAALAKIAMP
jgi:hypothetical protein